MMQAMKGRLVLSFILRYGALRSQVLLLLLRGIEWFGDANSEPRAMGAVEVAPFMDPAAAWAVRTRRLRRAGLVGAGLSRSIAGCPLS